MKTRLVFIGGFLGAGKTSLLLRGADNLRQQGYRVGVITNDQGHELVDTMLARSQGTDVAEVVGGCFCCRFHDLAAAIQRVTDNIQPDIILAEPVGSCTDIVATVLKPLERDFADVIEVAPFTVLLDPKRDLAGFPDTLDDLFGWQLAEADIIAVSKADLLSSTEVEQHLQRVRTAYPGKQVISISARSGTGVMDWLTEALRPAPRLRNVVPVDYIVYAEAEACLGWLNASLHLQGAHPFSPQQWMTAFITSLSDNLQAAQAEIAHVKMYVSAGDRMLKAGITGFDRGIDWELTGDGLVGEAVATVNARVRCEPDTLLQAVQEAARLVADRMHLSMEFDQVECFSPSPPQPVFRFA
jgi:G3E family GTPase